MRLKKVKGFKYITVKYFHITSKDFEGPTPKVNKIFALNTIHIHFVYSLGSISSPLSTITGRLLDESQISQVMKILLLSNSLSAF